MCLAGLMVWPEKGYGRDGYGHVAPALALSSIAIKITASRGFLGSLSFSLPFFFPFCPTSSRPCAGSGCLVDINSQVQYSTARDGLGSRFIRVAPQHVIPLVVWEKLLSRYKSGLHWGLTVS